MRSAPPGRHCDGNGLYLFVQRSGTRSWVQRLVIRGRRRDLGLGSVALVSLDEAREKARANRKLAREGGDPRANRRRTPGVPSFSEAAALVLEQKQAGWRSEKHRRSWIATLERYAFPRIGAMPVSDVTSADVLETLAPIWHTKASTARSVHQRIRSVLDWAVAMEFRADNPSDRLLSVLGPQHHVVEHMRALAGGVGGPFVFTRGGAKPLADQGLRRLLRKHGIAAVPHGFRSSFRDWAAEETDHPREVIEAALAHVVQNKVEAAYRRTDLFDRRRHLMNDWAAYVAP